MNGKIKTKFAALFAVALMITVCVVPVVGNDGTDAAPVSPSNGEVFEGYDITLYKEGGDYSGLVYHGPLPYGFSTVEWEYAGSGNDSDEENNGYWFSTTTGKYLLAEDIPGYVIDPEVYGMPMIQFVYGYKQVNVNSIDYDLTISSDNLDEDFTYNVKNYKPESKKTQGLVTVALGKDVDGYNEKDSLGLLPEMQVGDFDVEVIATQGITQQIINKTVNAGAAVTVSGTVKDAGGKAIMGAKITPIVGKDTLSALDTDEDGKYSFNVEYGSVVSISVAYPSEKYTFGAFDGDNEYEGSASYSFGTVIKSVTKDFVANEKTGTVTVQTANNKPISGIVVTPALYYQYAVTDKGEGTNPDTKTYEISTSIPSGINKDGKVVAISTSTDADGKFTFAYIAPTGSFNIENTDENTYGEYAYAILVYATDATNYNFVNDLPVDGDNSISKQISEKAGIADAKNGTATLESEESLGVITVKSSNGNPVVGVTVAVEWAYECKITVDPNQGGVLSGSHYKIIKGDDFDDFDEAGITPGTDAELNQGVTDDDGKMYFVYTEPSGKFEAPEGSGWSDYNDLLVAKVTNPGNYEFDVVEVSASDDSNKNVSSIISGKDGMANATSGSATLKAETESHKISGSVNGWKADGVREDGIVATIGSSTVDFDIQKDGSFAFYVVDKSVVEVALDSNITGYEPDTFYLGTVESNKVCDFTKVADPIEYGEVRYVVTGADSDVTFTYSFNGVEAKYTSTPVNSNAEIVLKAPINTKISISATADGYDISAFDGYVASALLMGTRTIQVIVDDDPYEGATFQAFFTDIASEEQVILDLTTGDNGFVTIELPNTVINNITFVKDSKNVTGNLESGSGFYEGISKYQTLDLTDYYSKSVGVAISYMSAYNSDTVLFAPVADAEIAPGKTVAADVGDSIALKAPSIDNFEFVAWMVDGVVVSEKADYTLIVEQHFDENGSAVPCTAVALYSAVHYEEPAEGLSMNVLVIGIVILILGILAVAYGIISKKQ